MRIAPMRHKPPASLIGWRWTGAVSCGRGRSGLLGAGALLTACARPARPAVDITMTATESDVDLGAGVVVRTWTWDGQVPAREIRLTRGQTMRVKLANRLPQDTTIHWHGLAIPNAMDGVPVLTQQPVKPGGTFDYEFAVPDAGTYWAHPHFGAQLDRGLYAPLIIEDPGGRRRLRRRAHGRPRRLARRNRHHSGSGARDAAPDRDEEDGTRRTGCHTEHPAGRRRWRRQLPVFRRQRSGARRSSGRRLQTGRRIRLRIINAGGDTTFRVGLPGVPMTVTHTDGFPVLPRQVDSVLLGMGERGGRGDRDERRIGAAGRRPLREAGIMPGWICGSTTRR